MVAFWILAPIETCAMPIVIVAANTSPTITANTLWPRIVSTMESDASTPTSITTNRNSIKMAPV